MHVNMYVKISFDDSVSKQTNATDSIVEHTTYGYIGFFQGVTTIAIRQATRTHSHTDTYTHLKRG